MAGPAADLSRGPVLLSFSLATASFAMATTFVRFYVRRSLYGGFGTDDYVSGAATLVALIATILGILEATAASGERAVQFDVAGRPWYLISATLSKISICLFFLRVLGRARQWRTLLAALIAIMAIITLAFTLFTYLQCRPLEKVWKPFVTGSCLDASIRMNFAYAQSAFSVFSWVFLCLFPVLLLRDISHGGEPTWPFYAASFLSLFTGIIVIVRIAQVPYTMSTAIYNTHFFSASLMANLEQNLALTCSNLLTFGPLCSPSATTTTTNPSSTSTSSTSRSRPKHHRRGPYNSFSSSGTRRSAKQRDGIPHRTGSSRSITRPDTADSTATGVGGLSRAGSRPPSSWEEGEGGAAEPGKRGGGSSSSSSSSGGADGRQEDVSIVGRMASLRRGRRAVEGAGAARQAWGVRGDGNGEGEEERWGHHGGGDEAAAGDIDLEAWPRGIIKTVSVEVVEEVNEEYVAATAAAAAAAAAASASAVATADGKGKANNNGVVADDEARAVPRSSSASASASTDIDTSTSTGSKGVGRNSVVIVPGMVAAGRQPRAAGAGGVDIANRGSGGSGIEQDWEAMFRAGPPR